MRIPIIVLLLFTLVSGVAAVDKSVWAYSGDPIEFQGETYYAYLDTTRTNAFVESNATSLILRLGTCKRENFVRYCFTDIANETSEWFRFNANNQPEYGARFTFESLGPSIQATQTYSTTTPDINSRVDGTITVRNTGNEDARDVTVTYRVSPSARITTCSDCDISNHLFSKRITRLRPGESQTITFAFTVERAEAFSSNASVTFSHEDIEGSISDLTRAFTIRKPYETSLSRPNAAPVGEWIPLRLTIRNTGENAILVDATQIRNASVSYETTPGSTSADLSSLEIEPGETITRDYRVRSTRAGSFGTGHAITIRRGSDVFEETLRQTLEWRLQDVKLSAQLSRIRPATGDSNRIFVSIENTGTLTFRNLDIVVQGEVEDERRITSISAGQRADVFDLSFTHPRVEENTEGSINVTLRYDTQFGEEQTTTITIPYTIVSLSESYAFRRVMQPSEPGIGESFTVTLYGEKKTQSAIQLSEIADQVIGARIERGSTRIVPGVGEGEARLYQYEGVREDERFAIITSTHVSYNTERAVITDTYTTFNLTESELETIEAGETLVEAQTEELESEETLEESEEEPAETTIAREEEPGFFARIANWFRNLFG